MALIGYEDEVADLMRGVTSPLDDPDGARQQALDNAGTATLASVGSPYYGGQDPQQSATATQTPQKTPQTYPDPTTGQPVSTGRYSQNGNELPPRLYNRQRGDAADSIYLRLPDAQAAAAQGRGSAGWGGASYNIEDDVARALAERSTPQQDRSPTVPPTAAAPRIDTPDTPATAQTGTAQSVLDSYGLASLRGQTHSAQQSQGVTDTELAQPSEADVLKPLEADQAAANTPLDTHAKPYRSGVGQRILRGLQGYARGGILGAVDPQAVGGKAYGAPNARFDHDEAVRQSKMLTTGERIQQAQAAYKARQAQLQQQAETVDRTGKAYQGIGTTAQGLTNAGTERMNARTTAVRTAQDAPAAKAAADLEAQNNAEKSRIAKVADPKSMFSTLQPWQIPTYIAEGKILANKPPEPTEGDRMFARIYGAWKADPANKGKRPTADDYAGMIAQSRGQETPTAKLTEQQTRDAIRTGTTKLLGASKAVIEANKKVAELEKTGKDKVADKASRTLVPSPDYVAAQAAVQKAQADYDAAEAALTAPPAPDTTVPGGGQPAPTPQTARVRAGTVTVGTPVTDGKRRGTVDRILPNGRPHVKWSN